MNENNFDRAPIWAQNRLLQLLRLRGIIFGIQEDLDYADEDNWQEPDKYVPYWTLWEDGNCIGSEKALEALKDCVEE